MRVMVTDYHQEAQKTRQVETYRLARDIYKQYVDAFATSDDPEFVSDSAFNMRFFYAEILWTLEEWDAAAAQYDAVVAFKVPGAGLGARGRQRELPQERLLRRHPGLRQAREDRARPARQERPQGRPEGGREQVQGPRREEGPHHQEGHRPGRGASSRTTRSTSWPRATSTTSSTRTTRTRSTCATRPRSSSTTAPLPGRGPALRRHHPEVPRRAPLARCRRPDPVRARVARGVGRAAEAGRARSSPTTSCSSPAPSSPPAWPRVVEGAQYKWIHEVVYQKEKNPAKAAGPLHGLREGVPALGERGPRAHLRHGHLPGGRADRSGHRRRRARPHRLPGRAPSSQGALHARAPLREDRRLPQGRRHVRRPSSRPRTPPPGAPPWPRLRRSPPALGSPRR